MTLLLINPRGPWRPLREDLHELFRRAYFRRFLTSCTYIMVGQWNQVVDISQANFLASTYHNVVVC